MDGWDFLDGRSMLCSRCLRDQRRERVWRFREGPVCQPCVPFDYLLVGGLTGVPLDTLLTPDCLAWVESLARKPDAECSDAECGFVALWLRGYDAQQHEQVFVALLRAYDEAHMPAPEAPPAEEPTSGLWPAGAAEGDMVNLLSCQCTDNRSLGIGDYGETFLIKFTTATGCDLVWFTGSGKEGKFDPQIGGTYDVRCKIKKFDAFKGHRSTVVSLCKAWDPTKENKRGK